ncbi:hypothetical protein [Priestia megaterium]|uniref:hypothetical protein n=1 Tax=Priestia megaterium TaxID=1404 RepID=UPI0035A8BA96
MYLFSGIFAVIMGLFMFFILSVLSFINPIEVLSLNQETTLNYFNSSTLWAPIISIVIGLGLIVFHFMNKNK